MKNEDGTAHRDLWKDAFERRRRRRRRRKRRRKCSHSR